MKREEGSDARLTSSPQVGTPPKKSIFFTTRMIWSKIKAIIFCKK